MTRFRVTVQNPRYGSYVMVWDRERRREVAQFPYPPKDANAQKIALNKARRDAEHRNQEPNYEELP